MIRKISIANFRCFDRVELDDLARVNVIVGENAAGKTSLLEAIFLASAGSPEKAISLKASRGLSGVTISRSRESYESLWRDLFFQMDQRREISIRLTGTPENTRHLRIWYDRNVDATLGPVLDPAVGTSQADSSAITPITFSVQHAADEPELIRPVLTADGLTIGGLNRGSLAAYYASGFATQLSPSESANRYSQLSIEGKARSINAAMRDLFPELRQLSVEATSNGSILHCLPPKSRAKRKLPVALVSSGINKLLSLLLGIATCERGVVLIDEIENGLYFQTFGKIWEALVKFSKRFDVQLFITSHSMECLRAAVPTMRRFERDFCLLRPEWERGKCVVRAHEGGDFEAALESNYEVR